MSRVKDNTPATAARACPRPCFLSSAIDYHLKQADSRLQRGNVLPTWLFLQINDFFYTLPQDLSDAVEAQQSLEVIRDCCVVFMPEAVTLVHEGAITAASDLHSYDVVMIDLETPYFDVQVISDIHRHENGAYAGLSAPLRCDNLREATGMSKFYPSRPPSARERTAARERLEDSIGIDFVAEACAQADETATVA